MVITAMQPRRRSFTALFLDGEWVCNLDTEILCRTGWQVGQAITPEELEEARQASDMRRAQEKALYLLEYRSHSKKELEEKIRRTSSREAAAAAADRMEELGLIDDEEYARRYPEQLLGRKKWSASRTVYELRQKGIDPELAGELVEELAEDPEEAIRQIVEKKYARCLDDEKGLRRAVQGLQRLGYRYADIRRVLREYRDEIDETEYEE